MLTNGEQCVFKANRLQSSARVAQQTTPAPAPALGDPNRNLGIKASSGRGKILQLTSHLRFRVHYLRFLPGCKSLFP